MIVYNSHRTFTLLRLSGSVLPAALKWAASAGFMALFLKILQNNYMPDGMMGNLDISPAAYSGFSFTLGFVIVFRTSQCYNRFWTCATHVNAMRAEWYEAASGLTTFIVMSDKSSEEQDMFCHKVIRYFSLLHSLALQALADGDEAFPVIDLESIPDESLKLVLDAGCDAEGMTARVELVYQWIQALIVHSMKSGLLNVPPPILTRVLQQMTTGMVNFNSVLDIISIPFPFPYAQVTFVLLTFYVMFVPIVMCLLVHEAWIAAICGFLSVLCLISVDLVSTEIENPFGQDANDLPCHEFQHKINKALLNLLHPAANEPPELLETAKMSFAELLEASFTMVEFDTPKFHGGKLKPRQDKPPPLEPKLIPVAKPKPKPEKVEGDAAAGGAGSAEVVTPLQPKEGAVVVQPPGVQQESAGYAQELIAQQATMLGEFVQSNSAVLERMDRTLHTLTQALTQHLARDPAPQRPATALPPEVASRSASRHNPALEEVPPCLSWSTLLSLPASRPGIPPSVPEHSAVHQIRVPNVAVQQVQQRSS